MAKDFIHKNFMVCSKAIILRPIMIIFHIQSQDCQGTVQVTMIHPE